MKKATLTISLLAALAGPAAAQGTGEGVARLQGVKGNVLVSREAGLTAGGESARLREHVRVITTAGAEVTVVYDNGCRVQLKENQRFEVEMGKPCAMLVAESILPVPAAAPQGAAFAFGALLPAATGAGIGANLFRDSGAPPLSPS